MKKTLWLMFVLSFLCAFSLSSCDNKNDKPSNNDTNQSTNGEQNTDEEEDKSEEGACQHTFGDWIVERQATCKEVGVLRRACTKCSEREAITIEKTNIHTEVIDSAIEATCEFTGLTEGKHCSVCEKVLVEQIEIPLKAHTYDDKYDETCNNCDYVRNAECAHLETETLEGKASTCTSAGLTEGSKCKKCGEILVEQEEIPELVHTYTAVVTAPTCTEQGYTTYTCTCNDSYVDDYTDASGHSFGDWTTVKEATTTEEGLQERTCKCAEKETRTIEISVSKGLQFSSWLGNGYALTGIGTCEDTIIVIPDTYNGMPVTHIKDGAFQNCATIESIIIPNNVTTIGSSAFSKCTALNSITIPDSVTSIGEWAFAYCSSLATINLPSNLTTINDFLFEKCTGLKNIVIPDNVTNVGYSFYGCTSLEAVTLGKGVVDVYFDAFSNSSVSTLIFKGSVIPYDENLGGTYINHFNRLNNLKAVIIEGNVTEIPANAFRECSALETLSLPSGLLTIGEAAFYKCDSLNNVTIPYSVTSIGDHAFYNCESITCLNISSNVSNIGDYAFAGCSSLESFIIPQSITSIGVGVFSGCSSLVRITIPAYVTCIGQRAFSGCVSLASVNIPNSVKSIDSWAFENCTSLRSIIIPNSVAIMGLSVFNGCSSFKIYCEAESQPSGWSMYWNRYTINSGVQGVFSTVWGYI